MTAFSWFAAIRVLVFSAAFPFFNNVDERRHFDLVIKYVERRLPRSAELISSATLLYLSHYASPEFLSAPEDFEGGYYGPMWNRPAEEVAPTIATRPASAPTFLRGVSCSGALIPFATLYVYGLNRLLRRTPDLALGAVGAIAITITISEVLANRVAFTSAYNWFHM
jgi:hypothetical protein